MAAINRQWTAGLFFCCENVHSCFSTLLLPCYTAYQIGLRIGFRKLGILSLISICVFIAVSIVFEYVFENYRELNNDIAFMEQNFDRFRNFKVGFRLKKDCS